MKLHKLVAFFDKQKTKQTHNNNKKTAVKSLGK